MQTESFGVIAKIIDIKRSRGIICIQFRNINIFSEMERLSLF